MPMVQKHVETLLMESQGQGICTYANGDRYEGGWEQHAPPCGEGVMYLRDGEVYGAMWDHGKRSKADPE